MSKDRDYVLFLEDILESIAKIEKYTEDLTYQEFQRDEMVIDAVSTPKPFGRRPRTISQP